MDNIIAQTSNEKIKKGLIYADTRFKDAMEEFTRGKVDEVGWNVKNLMKSLEVADRNIQATDLDNELKSRTMESNVKQAEETLKNTMADTLVKFSQGKLNKVQAEAIAEQIKQFVYYKSEKLEGTSFAAYIKDGKFGVCGVS